jgi:hypothetical protein
MNDWQKPIFEVIAPIRMHMPVRRTLTRISLRAILFSTLPKVRADYDEPIKEGLFLLQRRDTKVTRSASRGVVVVALLSFLMSCGTSVVDLCSQAVSVPSYTTRFIMGLDNFGEDQYENLRTDTIRTRETVALLFELYPEDENVVAVLKKIDDFASAMDATNWDVSVALRDSEAVQGATTEAMKAGENIASAAKSVGEGVGEAAAETAGEAVGTSVLDVLGPIGEAVGLGLSLYEAFKPSHIQAPINYAYSQPAFTAGI